MFGNISNAPSSGSQFSFVTAVEGDDTIHAAITLPPSGTTVVTTAITQPNFTRRLKIVGNASGISAAVTFIGTDYAGNALSETINASDTSYVSTLHAFKTLTSITVGARNAPGDTIAVGTPTAAADTAFIFKDAATNLGICAFT